MSLRRAQRYGLTSGERRYYRDGYLAGKSARKECSIEQSVCLCEDLAEGHLRQPQPTDDFHFNAWLYGIRDACTGKRMWWWSKEGFLENR